MIREGAAKKGAGYEGGAPDGTEETEGEGAFLEGHCFPRRSSPALDPTLHATSWGETHILGEGATYRQRKLSRCNRKRCQRPRGQQWRCTYNG